ncbi:MAG: sigma 54-interacting transcriptional regulator [Deltaproteobacteria bacterium]|nr:sigma 54-interacting transcriptional regulator [Deltaproteobacteria bacterium]
MEVAELVFHRGGQDLLHVRLHQAETCIGSHPTSDVLLPDDTLPDVAAVLVDRGAGRFQIRDLTSGLLRVNGAPSDADELPLKNGDRIELGKFQLRFQVRASAEPSHRQTTILDQKAQATRAGILTIGDRRFRIPEGQPFNIGSDDDNDLVIGDEFVSSFHCRITCPAGRWTLVDLASTNGTMVNGLRVGEAELPSPATIKVGQATLSFELEPSESEEAGPAEESSVFSGMIAKGPKMRRLFELVQRIADASAPVMITGESGSGKELIARALHDASTRASGPFLAINCGALASSIIEGELFGHVKGAFTGAQADKKGAFEAAEGGTIFLDEIGELPLELQPKLLRVLEQQTIRRVGGTSEIPVNARVVAATHRSLRDLVAAGTFREDLFHRLFVLNVELPPLRERPEDVLPLASHFLRTQDPARPMHLDASAEAKLQQHRWPGNVRELRNVILRAILTSSGPMITAKDLQFSEAYRPSADDARGAVQRADEEERRRILTVLEQAGDNRAEAARLLGLSKSTFHDRLKRLGIPLKFAPRK